MKKQITSKDEILKVCKEIVSEHGISKINMRTVSSKCQIALGSLYNYFPSKADLISATVESVWQECFSQYPHTDFICLADYISYIFAKLRIGKNKYPNFFTRHAVAFESNNKAQGRQLIQNYFLSCRNTISDVMDESALIELVNKVLYR